MSTMFRCWNRYVKGQGVFSALFTYESVQEIVNKAADAGKNISDLVLTDQAGNLEVSAESLYEKMAVDFQVMREAVQAGLSQPARSNSGMCGGDAYKLRQNIEKGRAISGPVLSRAIMRALAVAEVNAGMGKIVAAPTAGSCGVLPAVLLTVMEEKRIPEKKAVMGLFTAAGIGMVIARQASISGAEGGCQAEVGSASAMAAAALVEMMGGTPREAAHACAIALKNVLGLVCDPVAGLVESPCIKRNAMGAANALTAAEMALAGIESIIPVDEVIGAMKSIGDLMTPALKETAEGGLAATPTACRLCAQIFA